MRTLLNPARRLAFVLVAMPVLLAACADDGTDTATDPLEEIQEEARALPDTAREAWASLRTNAERLIDEAATGDVEAQNQLLDECRDALQDMRAAGDPDADRIEVLCDDIRDADDDTDWQRLRLELEEIDQMR